MNEALSYRVIVAIEAQLTRQQADATVAAFQGLEPTLWVLGSEGAELAITVGAASQADALRTADMIFGESLPWRTKVVDFFPTELAR
jgi:hypothetical protein